MTNARAAHSVDTGMNVDKIECDFIMLFRTVYHLKLMSIISTTFHLIFADSSWLLIMKNMKSEIANKGHCYGMVFISDKSCVQLPWLPAIRCKWSRVCMETEKVDHLLLAGSPLPRLTGPLHTTRPSYNSVAQDKFQGLKNDFSLKKRIKTSESCW